MSIGVNLPQLIGAVCSTTYIFRQGVIELPELWSGE